MKNIGDGKARAQPETKDAICRCDGVGRCREPLDGIRRSEILQVLAQRRKDVLNQRQIAFAITPDQQFLGSAAIALRPLANGIGK